MKLDYDAIARRYDQRYERADHHGIDTALADFAGGDRTRSILEVGCGTGHWLGRLARRGFVRLAGVDPSSEMLTIAAARLAHADLRRGKAESLPWPGSSFDRVCCVNALHHFDDPPRFMAEARRVLQGGGALMIIGLDPHAGTDRWAVYDYFDGTLEADRRRYPPADRIRGWLTAAGFHDVRTFVAQHIRADLPARSALAAGHLDRAATSQLTLLADGVFQQGIDRITSDALAAERRGATLTLRCDVRLFATVGAVG